MTFATFNDTRLYKVFQYGNTITDYAFGNLLLIAVFAILFISVKATLISNAKAFAYAAFITAIASILLRLAGVVGDFAMYLSIIGSFVGWIALYVEGAT